MKRILGISLVAAALLISGCNKKETEKSSETQNAQEVVKQSNESAQEAAKSANTEESVKETAKSVKESNESAQQAAKSANTEELAKEEIEGAKKELSEAVATIDAAKLYVKCAGCHGQKGTMKALGKSGIIAGKSKDELIKLIKGYKAGTLNQYGMGAVMKGQVGNLSDKEIEALAEYISKL